VRLSETSDHGSSLLPQKRKPRHFRAGRAKSGRCWATSWRCSRPEASRLGFSKDLQETKRCCSTDSTRWRSCCPRDRSHHRTERGRRADARARSTLAARYGPRTTCWWKPACRPRESGLVGGWLREAERSGVPLDQVPGPVPPGSIPRWPRPLSQLGTWEDAVESRATPGGLRAAPCGAAEALALAFARVEGLPQGLAGLSR